MQTDFLNEIDALECNLLYEDTIKSKGFVKSTIKNRMNYHKTTAVSIALIDDFKIKWTKCYGICDLNTQRAVDENTIFQAGSISKTVFSYAIMRLVQDGILNLDEDITHYLKSWKIPSTDGWIPKITLRQILSHTAGLTVHGYTGYKRQDILPDIIQLLNGECPSTTNDESVFVDTLPGLQFRYSGGGYTVAQLVMEDVLGSKFQEVLEGYVLKPLEMADSTYSHSLSFKDEQNIASGYLWHYIPVEGKWYNYPHLAAAGLWTTPSDLAKFGLELIHSYWGKSVLLSKDGIEQMITTYSDNNYGLGLRIKGNELKKQIYHSGSTFGYSAKMTLDINQGKGVVIMMNSLHEQLIDEIERAVFSVYNWTDSLPSVKSEYYIERNINIYEGKYSNDNGFKFKISVLGNYIYLKYGVQDAIKLIPYEADKFFSQHLNIELEFIKNAICEIIGMKLIQNGKCIEAKKQSTRNK